MPNKDTEKTNLALGSKKTSGIWESSIEAAQNLILPTLIQRAMRQEEPFSFSNWQMSTDDKKRFISVQSNAMSVRKEIESIYERKDKGWAEFYAHQMGRAKTSLGLLIDFQDKIKTNPNAWDAACIANLYYKYLEETFWNAPRRYKYNRIHPHTIIKKIRVSAENQSANESVTNKKPDNSIWEEYTDDFNLRMLGITVLEVENYRKRRLKTKSKTYGNILSPAQMHSILDKYEKIADQERKNAQNATDVYQKQIHNTASIVLENSRNEIPKFKLGNYKKSSQDFSEELFKLVLKELVQVEEIFCEKFVTPFESGEKTNHENLEQAKTYKGISYSKLQDGGLTAEVMLERMGYALVRVIRADGSTIVRKPRKGETPGAEFFEVQQRNSNFFRG